MSTLPRFEADMLPRSLVVDPPMTDAELEAFCLRNDVVQVERTSKGVIVMNPPTGGETSRANSEISARLFNWWSEHERGIVTDSSGGFYLPDRSMMSPDAAYISPETQKHITKERRGGFFPVCPDFVIELLSKSDTLAQTQDKMERWIANGAKLGWLIDPYRKQVLIYRPGVEPSIFTGKTLKGRAPVSGFNLDLVRIWRYYEEQVLGAALPRL
jgi:Uma2 family endonuclease